MARKILLADDSVTAQNMGRKILGDAGYDVVTVNNGSAALKRVSEQKPDLIVLDVYMPGYSGLEVCQRLKDSPETSDIPILLTVGKLEPFKPEEARRVRAEAFIVKPFEASELLSALTRLEDQVVPGRNGKGESHGDTETGWKNRIRFPSKKKKEEPAPEPEDIDFTAGTTNARGGRRGRGAAPEASPAAAKPVPDIPRDITPEELDALSALAAKLDGQAAAPADAAPAKKAAVSEPPKEKEFEVAAPAAEEKTEGKAPALPAVQAETSAAPAEEAKPAPEVPVELPPTMAAEAKAAEAAPVNVVEFAEKEPAPVDHNDEPIFAAAPPAEPEAKKVEAKESLPAPVEAEKPAEIRATAEEEKSDEAAAKVEAAETVVETPKIEAPAPVVAAAQSQEEVAAPSEEELAEALRALTPATTEAAAQAAATPAAVHAAAAAAGIGTSWTAIAVAVDPEEAGRSLEAEMFKTLAAPAAVGSPATEIVAESRSAAMAATATAGFAGTVVARPSLAEAPPHAPDTRAASDNKDSKEETAVEESAPVTFADAVRQNEDKQDDQVSARPTIEAAGKDSEAEAGFPVADSTTVSTSNATVGGEDDMAKEGGKNGKSNLHQVRNGSPAAQDAVEAAKAEDAPKAMAAAADGRHSGAADPSAIANIVDSVLADLRPKIVEEIAKKLSGK